VGSIVLWSCAGLELFFLGTLLLLLVTRLLVKRRVWKFGLFILIDVEIVIVPLLFEW